MPRFVPNTPIETKEPEVLVEGLPLGAHVFQLVVVDQDDNKSEPAVLAMVVSRLTG